MLEHRFFNKLLGPCPSREIRSSLDVESTSENIHFLKSRRGSRMNGVSGTY